MKKVAVIIIVIIAILMAIFCCNKEKVSEIISEKKIVKIGVSLPLTGELATFGQASKTALEVALKKWQERDTKYDYKLIFEDNKYDGKEMALVANKLVNIDKVHAYITIFSKAQLVAKPITENNKVINMGCSWGREGQQGFYNINNMTSPQALALSMSKKLKDEGIKTIALIFQQTPGAVEVFKSLEIELRRNDIDVVIKEFRTIGDRDYGALLDKIKIKKPDIIIPELFINDFKSFLVQMKSKNIKTPITSFEHFSHLDDKSIVEGKWFVKHVRPVVFSNDCENPILGEICAPNSYDNLDILISSFERVGITKDKLPENKHVIYKILSTKKWKSPTGKLIIMEDGSIDSEPYIAVIKNGRVQLLEE